MKPDLGCLVLCAIILENEKWLKINPREFWEKHADSEQYLKTWYDAAKSAKWLSPNDVKQSYKK